MTTNKLRFVETDSPQKEEDIAEAKKRLRAYMKGRRGENENRDIKEELLLRNVLRAIAEKGLDAVKDRKAFVYLSFSSEAPTDKLIQALLEGGWRVYCPRIENRQMLAVEYGEDFSLSSFGTREPIGEPYAGKLDLAVVPLLAVDEQGRRLGYGGGYYDRFLGEHPETLRLAYGFDFQIIRQVPTEEHDIKMDGIATDKRIVWTSVREK